MKKILFLFLCLATAIGWLTFFKQSLKSRSVATPVVKQNDLKKEATEKLRLIDLNKTDEKQLMKTIISACPKIISKTGSGTGFLFSNDGLVITAHHVIDDDGWVYVQFYKVADDYNELEESVLAHGIVLGSSTDDYDVTFIRIDKIPEGVKPLQPIPILNLADEQTVWRFGYNDHYKWAQGWYSPENCPKEHCKVTMPTGPGASGGPVVDGQGRVLGIFQVYNDSTLEMVTNDDLSRALEFDPSIAHFLPLPYINMWLQFKNIK